MKMRDFTLGNLKKIKRRRRKERIRCQSNNEKKMEEAYRRKLSDRPSIKLNNLFLVRVSNPVPFLLIPREQCFIITVWYGKAGLELWKVKYSSVWTISETGVA